MIKRPVLSGLLMLMGFVALGQSKIQDTTLNAFVLHVNYSFQIPASDMAQRFTTNSNIGAGFWYKTHKNFLIGAEGDFIFRDKIDDPTILDDITTANGGLINISGLLSTYAFQQRGFSVRANIGKVFPFKRPNPNSGLMAVLGLGMLQHKIKLDIEDEDELTPHVAGDYAKGYDRLTNGFMVSGFLGYMYLGPKKRINFYGGVEYNLGLTKNRRSWNYDQYGAETDLRTDMLIGFKVGWLIPIYIEATDKYYYY